MRIHGDKVYDGDQIVYSGPGALAWAIKEAKLPASESSRKETKEKRSRRRPSAKPPDDLETTDKTNEEAEE